MCPLFVLLATLIFTAASDPIVIRSGLSKDQAHNQNQNENIFDLKNIKGIANYEGEEGFNLDNESKFVKAQDSGLYNQENGEKKLHENANSFAGNKYHQGGGQGISDVGKKASNKKGHHKSGYTKSYHKDESGSNTSFYDDSDDEGGEYVHNTKKNSYGDSGQQSQQGADLDNRKYLQDEAKKGFYDNSGGYKKDIGSRRGYNGQKYYDNRENEGRKNLANQYGEGDRFAEEKFVQKPYYNHQPHYYHDEPYYNRRPVPQKTITVYEDPRYVDDGYEKYPQYDNDYVRLDFKRPTRGYDYKYYDRPHYDEYYY